MTDSTLAQLVRGRWTKLYDSSTEIFNNSEFYNQLYRSIMDDNSSYLWDYNLVDPVIFYLIRSLLARMNTENMKIKLEARNSDAEMKRKVNQRIIDWEIGEIKKTLVLYRFIYRGLISGRAYLKSGWKYAPALNIKSDHGDKMMRPIINRATFDNVRFNDLLVPNRNLPDIQEQPYVLERVMLQYGDVMKDIEAGDETWDPAAWEQVKKKKLFENKVDFGVDIPEDDEDDDMVINGNYVSAIRMQTKDNEVIYVLEKAEDLILNKNRENPYWHGHYPYITWTPFPEDDEYYSMGAVQPVADLAIAISSILNQYLTNARKSGNPMWLAGAAAAQTPDWMFVNRPDGIIRVQGDVNQVAQVRPLDTTDTMLRMRQEVQTSFERTTAMSSMYATGVAGGSSPQLNKTATGAKVIDSNIETNLQMLVSLFAAMSLSEMGNHALELNAQYITDEQEIKIVGKDGDPEFVRTPPAEITANFDCIANGDTMNKATPTVRQAQLLNLKSTMDAEKEVKLDKKVVWKQILNSFQEMDGVTDDIIIDPETQAKEAITLLLQGVEPKIPLTMDHKAVIQLVQVFLLSNPNMDPETLTRFAKYLDNLRKYVQAEQTVVTLNAPIAPTDVAALTGAMGGGANGTMMNDGKPLPANEGDLMKSLNSQIQLATNPTESLPNKIPEGM